MDYVFGYTVAHDVSARDWQLRKNNGQWGLGKTFDTFCPLGPVIVQKNGLSGLRRTYNPCVLKSVFITNHYICNFYQIHTS